MKEELKKEIPPQEQDLPGSEKEMNPNRYMIILKKRAPVKCRVKLRL